MNARSAQLEQDDQMCFWVKCLQADFCWVTHYVKGCTCELVICLEQVADREHCVMDSAGKFVEDVYQQPVDFYKQLSSPFP